MIQAGGPLSAHDVKFISRHGNESDNKRRGCVSELYCIGRLGRSEERGK